MLVVFVYCEEYMFLRYVEGVVALLRCEKEVLCAVRESVYSLYRVVLDVK